ncbi:MAG: phosphate ABC transporter substrate-binding protein [Clostridiales bacterium]|nr:phosphate ABC transporter substrate-binding protein [Clostridiales bacterium]
MKRWVAVLLILGMLSAGALAEVPKFGVGEYPKVDGSTAMLPLSYALMMASTGISEEEAKLAITHHKTTDSFYSLVDGEADILIVGNPAAEVFDYAAEKGVELEMKPIGVDALVFLISDLNPVEDVLHEEIVGVYTGKITNWKQLGGEDLPILAYQRNETAGSQVMMKNVVMKGFEMTDAPTEFRPGDMGELVDVVASYRNTADAVGYSVYYYVTEMYVKQGVKLLSVNGVAPSIESISSREYPYTQPNYAVVRKDEPKNSPARQLFDFLTTEEGKAFLAEHSYVPAA